MSKAIHTEIARTRLAYQSKDWKLSIAPIIIRSTDRVAVNTLGIEGSSVPGITVQPAVFPLWETRHFNFSPFLIVDTLDEHQVNVAVSRGAQSHLGLLRAIEQMTSP